jgi:hypothetical protein
MKDDGFPSKTATRIGLLILVPLTLLGGVQAISWAAAALKSWTSGETLTAADLNGNFNAINAKLDALQAQLDNVSKSGTWHLRASRPLALLGAAAYVDVTSVGTFGNFTDIVFDPDSGIPALPNSTRHYRLVIRSANPCQPADAVVYQLNFSWDGHVDNTTYPGHTWFGHGNLDDGGYETIDLDHIVDPAGGSRPTFWQVSAKLTNNTTFCGTSRIKGAMFEVWDVLN